MTEVKDPSDRTQAISVCVICVRDEIKDRRERVEEEDEAKALVWWRENRDVSLPKPFLHLDTVIVSANGLLTLGPIIL